MQQSVLLSLFINYSSCCGFYNETWVRGSTVIWVDKDETGRQLPVSVEDGKRRICTRMNKNKNKTKKIHQWGKAGGWGGNDTQAQKCNLTHTLPFIFSYILKWTHTHNFTPQSVQGASGSRGSDLWKKSESAVILTGCSPRRLRRPPTSSRFDYSKFQFL